MAKKTLVAYFSASGVTARLAKVIAETADADLFEIQPEVPYTKEDLDWTNKNSRSSLEMNDPDSRPAIAGQVEHMEQYDTVFIGFPIWWYVAPKIIHTFLESYDFSGKTLIPFATSGGSGMGQTDKVLKESCSSAVHWKPGKRLAGTDKEQIQEWIRSLS